MGRDFRFLPERCDIKTLGAYRTEFRFASLRKRLQSLSPAELQDYATHAGISIRTARNDRGKANTKNTSTRRERAREEWGKLVSKQRHKASIAKLAQIMRQLGFFVTDITLARDCADIKKPFAPSRYRSNVPTLHRTYRDR